MIWAKSAPFSGLSLACPFWEKHAEELHVTAIGSSSPSGSGIYSSYTIAPSGARILTGEAKERAQAESEAFTKAHAHLGSADYIKAKLEDSESKAPEQLASGFATTSFKVRFQDHVYSLAGTPLDMSKLTAVKVAPAAVAQSDPATLPVQTQAQLLNSQEVGEGTTKDAASPAVPEGMIQTFSRADFSFSLLSRRLQQMG
jgi:hypothetical protein